MKWPASGASLALVAAAGLAACTDPEAERAKATVKPTYDKATGKLTELTSDADNNGRIDTWTEMDGARPLRSRADRNEDGRLDRWEYYDEQGRVARVGFSRSDNGRADAWAFPDSSGRIARIETSSTADEKRIDRWEFFEPSSTSVSDPGGPVRAEEDTNADGRADKWETFERGVLRTAAFDENGDGRPDRRLTYEGASVILIESDPDAAGRFTKRTDPR